jgi:hypothetical protein
MTDDLIKNGNNLIPPAKAALIAPLQVRVTARGVPVDDRGICS